MEGADGWKGEVGEVGGRHGEVSGVVGRGVRRVEGKAKNLMEVIVEIQRDLDKVGVRVSATLGFRTEG